MFGTKLCSKIHGSVMKNAQGGGVEKVIVNCCVCETSFSI